MFFFFFCLMVLIFRQKSLPPTSNASENHRPFSKLKHSDSGVEYTALTLPFAGITFIMRAELVRNTELRPG